MSGDFIRVSDRLTDAITPCIDKVVASVHAKGLISFGLKEDLVSSNETNSKKATRLVTALEAMLRIDSNPDKFLSILCTVLKEQGGRQLPEIADDLLTSVSTTKSKVTITPAVSIADNPPKGIIQVEAFKRFSAELNVLLQVEETSHSLTSNLISAGLISSTHCISLLNDIQSLLHHSPYHFTDVLDEMRKIELLQGVATKMEKFFMEYVNHLLITCTPSLPTDQQDALSKLVVQDNQQLMSFLGEPEGAVMKKFNGLKLKFDLLLLQTQSSIQSVSHDLIKFYICSLLSESRELTGEYYEEIASPHHSIGSSTLLFFQRNGFLNVWNYEILDFIISRLLRNNKSLMDSLEEYRQEYDAFFDENLEELQRVFIRENVRSPQPKVPSNQLEFRFKLSDSWSKRSGQQWRETYSGKFPWFNHTTIKKIVPGSITVVYVALPCVVSAVMRDLTDPVIITELQSIGVTVILPGIIDKDPEDTILLKETPSSLNNNNRSPLIPKRLSSQHPKSNRARLQQWINNGNRLSILVTGKTGVGKSALINGLVGKKIAEEGGITANEGGGVTETVTPCHEVIHDIPVTVIDSPGFQAPCQDIGQALGRDKDFTVQIRQELASATEGHDIDVVLYCFKLTDARIIENEEEAMKCLSEQFPNIWSKTVFVIAQANRYRYDGNTRDSLQLISAAFREEIEGYKVAVLNLLRRAGHPQEDITVVPAGYYRSCPQDINPNDQWYLPGYEDDWLSILWAKCANKLVGEPLLAMVGMAAHRFVQQGTVVDGNQQIHDRPIVINKRNRDFKEIAIKMGASMEGETGALVGGTFGFLGAVIFVAGFSIYNYFFPKPQPGFSLFSFSPETEFWLSIVFGTITYCPTAFGCGAVIGQTIWSIFFTTRRLMSVLRFF